VRFFFFLIDQTFRAISYFAQMGFLFSGVIPIFETLRCEQIGTFSWSPQFQLHLTMENLSLKSEIETDAHGVKSSSIRDVLENWPVGKPKPKALYTIPVSSRLGLP
jgi:tryptophan aminotransferase